MEKHVIAQGYDESTPLYRYFWYLNSDSFALHYGLWEKETKHIEEPGSIGHRVLFGFQNFVLNVN
jgi:hypothetical protein